jgi:amino acid transporter
LSNPGIRAEIEGEYFILIAMNFETIGLLIVYLFPVAFVIVIARKILFKEEIKFVDILLTIYTVIWIIILISIGIYSAQYYTYIKMFLGIKEEYLWVLTILALFLLIYNILLRWKVSKAKKRTLDKW